MLGCLCLTTWPDCALGEDQNLGDACHFMEHLQATRCVLSQKDLLLRTEGAPDTVYPPSRSQVPWVGSDGSLRFGALSSSSATSLLHQGLSWILLGSRSLHRTLYLWVSLQFQSLSAPQSPWKGNPALSKHFVEGQKMLGHGNGFLILSWGF